MLKRQWLKTLSGWLLAGLLAMTAGACGDKSSGGNNNNGQADAAVTDGALPSDGSQPDAAEPSDGMVADGAPADGAPTDGDVPDDGTVQEDALVPTDGGGPTCVDNTQCSPTQYCAKPDCVTVTGICTPKPTTCNNNEQVVCGCDGVNYFNECLANLHGQNVESQGQCSSTSASLCGPNPSWVCPNNAAVCAFLIQNAGQCQLIGGAGSCWVLPATCPASIAQTWRPCTGPTDPCVDLCNAVQSGGKHYPDSSCP
jgi:hypothetical protein